MKGSLVLLVLGLAGWMGARSWYAAQCLDKLDPTRTSGFSVRSEQSTEPRTLMLLGDSRIAQWGLPRIPGFRVINAGTPGITTPQLKHISLPALQAQPPTVLVVQAGINDLKLIGVRPQLRDQLVKSCVENLAAIASTAAQKGSDVVILKVWASGPVPWHRRPVWSREVEHAILEVNRLLEDRHRGQPRVRVVDIFEAITGHPEFPNIRPSYLDTLHLDPETYAAISPRLAFWATFGQPPHSPPMGP